MIDLINLKTSGDFRTLKNRPNRLIQYYRISGLSCDSEYVPLFAPLVNKGIYNKQVVHFSLPKEVNFTRENNITSYPTMYRDLDWRTRTRIFKTKSMNFELLIIKGAIFEKISSEEAELLFTIAVKEDYMVQMFKDKPDYNYSKFVILISDKFTTDDKYKTIYRKVYKELIVPHLEKGVDIIITRNIVDKCFTNKVETPKFSSFTMLKEYLEAFNLEI
jgi:hypothetical protein